MIAGTRATAIAVESRRTGTSKRLRAAVVCLLSGCAHGAPTRAPVAVGSAPIAAAVAAPPPIALRATPWAIAYERACLGSETAPFVNANGSLLGFCNAVFSFDAGTRLGPLPVGASAFTAERDVISASYGGEGVEIATVLGENPLPWHTLGAGWGREVEISPDGKRAIAAIDESEVVVLAVPGLERIDGAPVESAPARTGFLADGTPVVLVQHGCVTTPVACDGGGAGECSRTTCAGWELARVAHGSLVDMGPQFSSARMIAFARNGSRAVIEREDLSRAVVALPSGNALVALPSGDEGRREDEAPFALSDDGDRVAYFSGGRIVIAALGPTGSTPLHTAPFASASAIAFSPDGHTVFAKSLFGMVAFREGAPEMAAPVSKYAVTAPAGFHETFHRDTPASVDRAYHDDADGDADAELNENEGVSLPTGAVSQFRGGAGDEITVTVSMLDPRELGEASVSLAEWAARAATTDEVDDPVENVHTWKTGGGRALEYVRFVRKGCEPSDDYVRFTERGGAVYRVEIEAPPGTKRKVIAPLERVFFDTPLGEPTGQRAFATPAPLPPGPC